MKNFLRSWLGFDQIIQSLEETNKRLNSELAQHKQYVYDQVHKFLDETRIDCEVGVRGNNTVVITGVYKNKGYVEFYDMDAPEFHDFVEQLKYRRKEHLIRHVDGPRGFHFRSYFDIKGKNSFQ